MRRSDRALTMLLLAVVVGLAVAGCSTSGVGTIPSGTPDVGNGTPAVIPSPGPTMQPIAPAPPGVLGATYAFVRGNQIWVALHSGKAAQATAFRYANLPDVSWHVPVWSPGDRYVAFIMNAHPAGQGGGGCPAPDYGANGALYVLNTATMQLTQLMVPQDKGDPLAGSAYNGYWQFAFWQDATHLLAWYNGIIGQESKTAGLYRYDLATRALAQILPLSSLGVATLFTAQSNQPLLLGMQYSQGQLYYQVVVHPFEQVSQFVIYRRSLDQPAKASSIFSAGSEAWCGPAQRGPFERPGWAISPDGMQLAVQVVSGAGNSSIQVLSLSDHTVTPLLEGLPESMLAHDMELAWGSDSQTVVASQAHLLGQDGPYSATLANPAALQAYTPGASGPAIWRADGAAFALSSVDSADVSDGGSMYVFTPGNKEGQMLLMNARDFAWG